MALFILASFLVLALVPGGQATPTGIRRDTDIIVDCMGHCRAHPGWSGYKFSNDPWGIVVEIDSSSSDSAAASTKPGDGAHPPEFSCSPTVVQTHSSSVGATSASSSMPSSSANANSSTSSLQSSMTPVSSSLTHPSTSSAPTFAPSPPSNSTSKSTTSPSAPTSPSPSPSPSSSSSSSSSPSPSPSPSPPPSSSSASASSSSFHSSSSSPPLPKSSSAAPSPSPSPTPANLVASNGGSGSTNGSTSESDIQAYLAGHNIVRAQHDAAPLTYSPELATKAQHWVNGCVFKHSGGVLGPYGENIAAGTGDGYGIPQALKSWTDEASEFNHDDPVPSHFTQVVWKGTTQVGCAVQECDGIFPSSYGKAHYYVCEYFPQGNIIGLFGTNVQ